MHKIKVKGATGYRAILPLKIYDNRKKLFYVRNNRNENANNEIFFNLPKGTFYCVQALKMQSDVVSYQIPTTTPIFEKNRVKPQSIKLIYGNNPNKASVILTANKMTILMDNQYRKKGRLFSDFIIRHELGHFFYKTEAFADLAAYLCMIKEGFNPSQIFYACALTLNRNLSIDRIFNIFDLNSNTKKWT